jgi:hypothetical protein
MRGVGRRDKGKGKRHEAQGTKHKRWACKPKVGGELLYYKKYITLRPSHIRFFTTPIGGGLALYLRFISKSKANANRRNIQSTNTIFLLSWLFFEIDKLPLRKFKGHLYGILPK